MDNRTTDTIEKIPFLGDIPILGKFFQSKSVSKSNTELIVIVTPELVRPSPVGQELPSPKFSTPFLATNTGKDMRAPGPDVTGPVSLEPTRQTMPVEKLLQSLRPLTPQSQPAACRRPSATGLAQPAR